MHADTLLDRSLWPIVLTIAVVLVALSFARGPLSSPGASATTQGQPLTLWVAGSEAAGETEALAHQLAACGQLGGHQATVGVIPGGSVEAIGDFLDEVNGMRGELLLLTSGVLSQVAYDARQPPGSETGELGRQTATALRRAKPIAVLGDDSVTLAVGAGSRVKTTEQLLALMRTRSRRPLLSLAAEPWLEGGLASLAEGASVEGAMPFDAFRSSREAVANIYSGQTKAVLAPHGALTADLHASRLRELPWPSSQAAAPKGWVAILAPGGLPRRALAGLREQAHSLCSGSAWRKRLRSDGLTPAREGHGELRGLIGSGLDEAKRLQALAAATVRGY